MEIEEGVATTDTSKVRGGMGAGTERGTHEGRERENLMGRGTEWEGET